MVYRERFFRSEDRVRQLEQEVTQLRLALACSEIRRYRDAKNYAESDRLREELKSNGYTVTIAKDGSITAQ